MKKLLPLFSFILLCGFMGAQNVVFHEDFEQPSGADSVTAYSSDSGNVNTWGVSTDLAAGGLQSDSAKCSPYDTLTLTTNTFSTTGNAFVTLDFDHIAKIELVDKAIIEVSIDGGASWTKLDTTHYMGSSTGFGNNGNVFNVGVYSNDWHQNSPTNTVPKNTWWKHETFNISSMAADESNVQVRFSLIDGGNITPNDDYAWFLDNIKVAAATSELVPPEIVMATPIVQDTVTSSAPQTIKAEITDDDSNVDTAYVVYYINGNLTDTLGMTNFQTDSFKADIPFPGYGRTITYFVEAVDDAAAQNIGTSNNYSYFLKYITTILAEGFNGGSVPSNWDNNTPWDHETGSTGSSDTGPDGPYEGSGYVYTEASGNYSTKELTSPSIDLGYTSAPSLTFYYHMYGADMGFLSVNIYDGSIWHQAVWSKSGEKHTSDSDPWTKATIDLTSYKNSATKIRFRGIIGSGYKSDMAVDDVKIKETQVSYVDAGIAEITNPTGGMAPNNNFDVKVKFQNKGGVNLNKVDIDWEVDGTSKSTYNWTGTLEPDSISSELTLGTESVSSGPHDLKVWTTNPNDTVDFNIANDTMHFSFYGCDSLLSGTYTIGGSNPDYATFTDAALALNQCGIDGAVTFNVASGTYDEQITLTDINGASATNTITFQSATGDSSDVTLQYAASGAGDNHVVKLEGTSFITFKDMTFKAQDNTWPRVFAMNKGGNDISLSNNRFEGVNLSGGGGSADSALVVSEDSVGNNFTFTHNYFNGGTQGLNISGNDITNVTVNNNKFINQWSLSVGVNGANTPEIKNNLVETNSMNNSFSGIRLANSTGNFEIAYNEVYAPSSIIGYGFRLENTVGDSLNHGQVYNNMATVRGVDGSTTISAGIFIIESRFIDYYYNTFRTIGSDELATPLCLYDNNAGETRYLTIKNNILANNTGGQIIYTQNIDTTGFDHDYNNYYRTGSNIFGQFNGDDVDDFATFRSMTGQENNSVQYDPYFADTTDLHVSNNYLNNLGTPIAGITDDIDGDSRDATTPDMGADEFDASPYDLAVLDVYGPQNSCGLSSSEDITIKVKNIGSSNISSFDASYMLLNDSTTVTETVTTPINSGDTLEYTFSATVDMDMSPFMVDTTFEFKAWVNHSNDPVPQNDTGATSVLSEYQPPAPTASAFSTTYGDSATITATSNDTIVWYETDTSSNEIAKGKYFTTPQLYDTTTYWVSAALSTGKQPIITEICHFQTSTGSPTGGWPTYLEADDYIEITGTPGYDLEGITLEQWDETSMHNSYTFPQGTVLSPNGTAIIAVGKAYSSIPSPSDYYYHADVSKGFSSTEEAGRILKDEKGEIIDAVGYGAYSFPAASGVTSADWSGNTPSAGVTCGNRLEGPYTKDATNWINSYTSPQDPNTKNANLVLPDGLNDCESPRTPVTVNVTGIPTEDAGPVAMISPASSVQEGSQEYIDVEVKNYAVDPLTSLDISWELDGNFQKTYNWSGNISYKEIDTIRIDTAAFAGGNHDIRFWTSQPNGTADTINSNDTLSAKFTACLHGVYTIGDTTGGNFYDYPSFTDAVNVLTDAGVCSGVTFEADSGVYNEQLHLTPIQGVDSANTVTFTSMSGDSTDVVVEYTGSSSAEHTIKLDSSKYITISHMTIKGLDANDAQVITFEPQSHHNKILNNVIEAGGTGSDAVPVYSSGNEGVNFNIIRNNHIISGEQGIVIDGDFGNENKGNIIEGNFLENFYEDGIVFENQDSGFVLNNTLTTNSTYSYGIYGIDLDGANRVHVLNNKIIHKGTAEMDAAINVLYCDGTTNYHNLIANNFVAITNGSDENIGLHLDNSPYTDAYYNTVNITGGSDQSSALYLDVDNGDSPVRIVNNIFRDSVGYAITSIDHDGVTQMDYNNYYSESSNFIDWDGTTIADLSALQAQTGMDANSHELLPNFVSTTDLHLEDKTFAGKGTALAAVTTDIDGKQRGSNATNIGAHEVDLLPEDIGITNIINLPSSITEFDTITPHAVVINIGTDTIADYAIDYTIDGGTPVTKQITGDTILPYGYTDTIPLDTFISPGGNYQLCATTVLSTDSNLINDENCKDHFATPVIDGKVTHVGDLVSGCNLSGDTIRITIKNMGIDTIDPGFDAKYQVNGNTLVTETVTSQILPNDSITFEFADLVDLSVTTFDSIFNIAAWVEIPNDNVTYNDTNYVETKSIHTPATPIVDDVTVGIGSAVTLIGDATAPISWFYQDTASNSFHIGDTLQTDILYADTTFWFQAKNGMGELIITEVTQFHGGGSGSGATSPEPSWLDGDDFVEITNMGASSISLKGYTHHREGSGDFSYDLPDITLDAGEVIVLATSDANGDDPANNFYVAADNSVSSGTETGHWLTNDAGDIVDAVALNGHSFSSASGVTSSHWSGNIPSSGGNAGVVRINEGNNSASEWEISSQTQQTLGDVNPTLAGIQIGQACNSPRDSVQITVITPDYNAGISDISVPSGCDLGMEPVTIDIVNIGQDTIDGGLTASFKVDNNAYISPENVPNVIYPFDTASYTFNTMADLSGISTGDTSYVIESYVSLSGDTLNHNDTIMTDTIKSLYTPPAPVANDTTTAFGDSITLTATSNDTLFWYENDTIQSHIGYGKYFTTPVLYNTTTFWVEASAPSGQLVITEVAQYHNWGDGATDPEPSWLDGDDFVEITNLGSAPVSLDGYTHHREGSGDFAYDLPDITLDVGEVIVLATYGASGDDPANNFYEAADNNKGSATATGHWLTNKNGEIIDAVALNSHSFSSASGVTSAYWSGDISSSNGKAGVIRTDYGNYSASEWIVSTTNNPQTLGTINPYLTNVYAGKGCSSPRVPLTVNIPKVDTDAGVRTVVTPVSNTTTGDDVTVEVEVQNYGYNTQTSFPVTYQINNNAPVTETWNGNLTTDQTDTYTFNTTYTAPVDDYKLTTYTELANDGNTYNDTVSRSITSEPADQDVGIVDMKPVGNSYNDTTLYGKDISVKVWIHNFGKQDITSMDVEYEQNNNTPVTEIWNGNLASGDTVEYTFSQNYTVGITGSYPVCGRTLLSGDAYNANDEYCTEWTGFVGLESNDLPGFVLHQNIPNPANEETSIDFEVPYGGKADFEVVDMFGRTLYSNELSVDAGRHTVDLNAQSWAAGVYYYSVTFDGHKLVRKMLVTK